MINIIFASQTGTSEDVALQLAQTLKQKNISSVIKNIDQITINQLKTMKYALFLISTTGDGESTDSMIDIWNQLLNKSLNKQFLVIKFSVFGFGDSKYGDNFNAMARKLERRLTMLGCRVIAERGLGDEQDSMGYRNQYNVWVEGVLAALEADEKIQKTEKAFYEYHNQAIETKQLEVNNIDILQKQAGRLTYYVQFKTQLINQPGDVLTIYAKNKSPDVEYMLKYFDLKGDEIIQKQNSKLSSYKMFKQIINLSDTAPYTLFSHLFQYIQDPILKNKLKQIKQDYKEYFLYVKQYRKTIVQVLQDFPIKMNLNYFMDKINFIKPRKFSIASCKKGIIGLLVRLIEYNITPHRKIYGGVSKGLLDEGKNSKWRGYVTPGKFKFQKQYNYLMVSVGTGIAPFLSFLDHENRNHTKIFLNFGNRDQKQFYRKSYIDQKLKEGNLIVKLAYSRIEINPIHVQQLFKLHKDEILQFFNKTKTRIYICGPYSNFAQSIIVAFQKALGLDDTLIKNMKNNDQIVSECW